MATDKNLQSISTISVAQLHSENNVSDSVRDRTNLGNALFKLFHPEKHPEVNSIVLVLNVQGIP